MRLPTRWALAILCHIWASEIVSPATLIHPASRVRCMYSQPPMRSRVPGMSDARCSGPRSSVKPWLLVESQCRARGTGMVTRTPRRCRGIRRREATRRGLIERTPAH